jgi:hypothetical protein
MVVSLPGGGDILKRLNVQGKQSDSAPAARLEIPLTGTRQAPRLDIAEMIKRDTIGTLEKMLFPGDK